ncbi:MAG: hypothetical protein J0H69_16150 [Burkholderiales bacterium]|nr:hypothetical protein [Burkholderiales bacterium]
MTKASEISGLDGWFQEWSEHDSSATPLAQIGGTYTIYTGRLTDTEQNALVEILRGLPGWDEASGFYFGNPSEGLGLGTSWEPSGIQVFGHVPAAQWATWDLAFRTAVENAKLPRFLA